MNLSRTLRYHVHRFKRLQGSIPSVAMGSAIGAAIAVTPTIPLHSILILGCTLLFRVNAVAGMLMGALVSNPLTLVAHYYLAWKIGDFCFPGRLSWERLHQLLGMIETQPILESLKTIGSIGFDALLVMMTGGVLLAVPTGVLTYVLVYRFFLRLRRQRRQRHLLNDR